MAFFLSTWAPWRWGAEPPTPPALAVLIVRTNVVALVSVVACLMGLAFSLPRTVATWPSPLWLASMRDVGFALAFILVLVCNRMRHSLVARMLLIIAGAAGSVLGAVLHDSIAVSEMLLFPMILLIFMIFRPEERRWLFASLAVPFITFVMVEVVRSLGFVGLLPPVPHFNGIATLATLACTATLAIIFFRGFWANKSSLDLMTEQLRIVSENVDDGIWIASSEDNRLLYANPGVERQLARALLPGESYFSAILSLVPDVERDAVKRCLEKSATEPCDVRFSVQGGEGGRRHFWLRSWPVRDTVELVRCFCGVTSDTTLEVEAQKELAEQRARMVTASRLSLLGELAAGVAHEVNNPLTIISGRISQLLRLLQETPSVSPKAAELCDSVQDGVRRIAIIVRDLLAFARGGSRDPFAPASLQAVVRTALSLCEERLKSSGVRMTLQVPEEDLVIECREPQLVQVVLNLILNSFDAVGGFPEPWIRIEIFDLGPEVELAVVDCGRGIPAEVAERMFDPFFTTKAVGRGTGLGLSVSRGLVEGHSGSLRLDAECAHTRIVMRLLRKQSR